MSPDEKQLYILAASIQKHAALTGMPTVVGVGVGGVGVGAGVGGVGGVGVKVTIANTPVRESNELLVKVT